jgi:hypothetical protein
MLILSVEGKILVLWISDRNNLLSLSMGPRLYIIFKMDAVQILFFRVTYSSNIWHWFEHRNTISNFFFVLNWLGQQYTHRNTAKCWST